MSRFNEELPDELQKRLRVEAAKRGVTKKDLVIEILGAAVAIIAPAKKGDPR